MALVLVHSMGLRLSEASVKIVLDNASAHTAKAFKGRRRQLTKTGGELCYLPPYSPELNDIELV